MDHRRIQACSLGWRPPLQRLTFPYVTNFPVQTIGMPEQNLQEGIGGPLLG